MGREEEKTLSKEEVLNRNSKFIQSTDTPLRDKIYNWVLMRYSKHGHLWTTSDKVIWSGAIYVAPEWIGYILWFAVFMLLAKGMLKKYGDAYTIVFFMLFLAWRVQKIGRAHV